MKSRRLFVWLVAITCILTTSDSQLLVPCRTPNNRDAYCRPLRDCTVLYNALEKASSKNFLKASLCDFRDQKNPFVCCGNEDSYSRPQYAAPAEDTPDLDQETEETFSNNRNQNTKFILQEKCGRPKIRTGGYVVGGVSAQVGEYPWMARLIQKNVRNQKQFGCTGFLIHPEFVVTAAHCFNTKSIQARGPFFEVELGEHDVRNETDCDAAPDNSYCADPVVRSKIKNTVIHPGFRQESESLPNDVALIRIERVQLTDWVHPICIRGEEPSQNVNYYISGWGKTKTEDSSSVKQKVQIPSYSFEDCKTKYETLQVFLQGGQLCAGGVANKDSCNGDSGGPLMIIGSDGVYYADGIVSFGLGCGYRWPGVYTKVAHYLPWVTQTAQELLKS